ncbi:MAG: diaminopimelate decarboxylase [Chloroflexi bacterium]|nr:diaminopimelate decarboxylase [Chloroflexota bacterium]
MAIAPSVRSILPLGASTSERDHLVLGGCDAVELAERFGTPLYVYDEATIRARAREYLDGLRAAYPNALVLYASKAFSSPALLEIVKQEGLGLDVVSGGELHVALRVDFPSERIYFHGNNKAREELELALDHGVGRVVVDNLYELDLLAEVAAQRGRRQPILLRLTPGVEAHTHDYRKTGILDSKFGFPIATGQAEEAVRRALALPSLDLLGYHAHIGSQIFELEPYVESIRIVLGFARAMQRQLGVELREFSPGGGWGIAYTRTDDPQPVAELVATVAETVHRLTGYSGASGPRLVLEPGRSIVGTAGVALYRVGAIKRIPQVRTYVAVDGGMADNIRPALYQARYEALLANRMSAAPSEMVTVVGKYCESGDVLIRDVELPPLQPGDVLALPASGAYNLAMSSNYNHALKPAVVLARDGQARLIRRRQTYEDLLREELGYLPGQA